MHLNKQINQKRSTCRQTFKAKDRITKSLYICVFISVHLYFCCVYFLSVRSLVHHSTQLALLYVFVCLSICWFCVRPFVCPNTLMSVYVCLFPFFHISFSVCVCISCFSVHMSIYPWNYHLCLSLYTCLFPFLVYNLVWVCKCVHMSIYPCKHLYCTPNGLSQYLLTCLLVATILGKSSCLSVCLSIWLPTF
jgi:hypothetical protein